MSGRVGWVVAVAAIVAGFVVVSLVATPFALSRTYRAEFPRSFGLGEEAAVYFRGLQAGKVTAMRLIPSGVEVEFTLESQHRVVFKTDACVIPGPMLIVVPGRSGGELKGPLQACEVRAENFQSLARSTGEHLRGVVEAFAEGSGLTSTPPKKERAPSICEQVRVTVVAVQREPSVPLLLPRGGYRVTFEFRNTDSRTVTIGPNDEASLLDPFGNAIPIAEVLAGGECVSSFPVVGGGARRVSVVVPSKSPPKVDQLVVGGCRPINDFARRCTVRVNGLSGR